MKPFLSLFFPALLIVVPFHLLSGQCLVSPGPLAQRVQQATIVIEGEVIAKRSFWDTAKGLIYTENTIAPFMQFKGRTSAPVYQLITHGGVVGNRAIRVSPSLQLEVGTIGVFLLKESPIALADADPSALRPISVNGAAFLHSPDHHHIQSDVDGVFEREVFYEQMSQLTGQEPKLIRSMRIPRQNGRMTPSITSFTPTTETAGTGDQITITGTNFGATAGTVFFSNADDGGATFVSAAAAQIVSWADTEIDVVVPSGAGTGPIIVQDASATNSPASATNLIITYNISNILREEGRLIDDAGDANGGYFFQYSTNTANSGVDITTLPAATIAAEAAASTWNTGTGVPFFLGIGCGTTTTQIPGDDGINIISFESGAYDISLNHSTSTLAVCLSQYSSCGPSDWEVVGMDIIIRQDGASLPSSTLDWNYGPASPGLTEHDFESIILHELGHGHQLGHIISAGDVMHYAIAAGDENRTLDPTADVGGGNHVITTSCTGYSPPLVNCGGGNDFNTPRQCAVYNASNDCGILGLDWMEMNGKQVLGGIALDWTVRLDEGGEKFVIEKVMPQRGFTAIAGLPSRKGRGEADFFQYLDPTPFDGMNHYRIRFLDANGESHLSDLLSVRYASEDDVRIQQPPDGEQLMIWVESQLTAPLQLRLLDLAGKQVLSRTELVQAGRHKVALPLSGLPAAMYVLECELNGRSGFEKVLVR